MMPYYVVGRKRKDLSREDLLETEAYYKKLDKKVNK